MKAAGRQRRRERDGRVFLGVAFVAAGVLALLGNLGLVPSITWDVVWPILLIAFGTFLVLRRLL